MTRVVFYTDGLTDLRPPHGRTEEEFVALVEDLADGRTASQLSEDLHSAVTEHGSPSKIRWTTSRSSSSE